MEATMDRFNEETAADLMGSFNRRRFLEEAYETFAAQDNAAEKCGSCGRATTELFECYWDARIGKVCRDCRIHSDEEGCPVLFPLVSAASTVSEILEIIAEHKLTACPHCTEPEPPFELTSPTEMPRLEPIRARVIMPSAPEFTR